MKTFAQLLSAHTARTSISDAELARHLGVRRQTIFRWKEGLVQRPRHREDVERLAAKLRLSVAEKNELLLAAGFAPQQMDEERMTAPDQPDPTLPLTAGQPALSTPAPASRTRPIWLLAPILLVLALTLWIGLRPDFWRQTATNLGIAIPTPVIQATWPASAAPDETLIAIAEFANYGGEAIGYNVAGRLQTAIAAAMSEAGLDARVEVVPVAASHLAAREIAQRLGAALIVWGEYDSGRVLVSVSSPGPGLEQRQVQQLLETPEDLNAAINTELPDDVRWLALIAVGQVHYLQGHFDDAESALRLALERPPEEEASLSLVHFLLGLISARPPRSDPNQAIAHYSEAIALAPGFVTALNNRGAAYLQRNAPGDLERGERDFRATLALAPDYAASHLNLALTLQRLAPAQRAEIIAEFETAQRLEPESPGANNALCWYYGLDGRLNDAFPFCQTAVSLDDSGFSHDSRGLVLAQLGRYDDAIADFQFFLDRLQQSDPVAYARFQPTRQAWIDALRQGRNPFDAATIQRLLSE